MKYCKDFDHYTSLILAQHPFMCIIMHFSSHYTNNMQRLHKILVLCNASCKLFLFLSSLSAFSAHYYLQPARQAKQEPARQAHQKPARLPAASRIKSQRGRQSKSQRGRRIKSQHACPPPGASSEKRIKKQSFSILFISSYSGCSLPPPGRDNVLPPSQSLASLFLS